MSNDRTNVYRPDTVSSDSANKVTWPTDRLLSKIVELSSLSDDNRFSVFVAVVFYIWLMLFQVAWVQYEAIITWTLVCSFSFLASLGATSRFSSTAPLSWWIWSAAPVFICVNFFATGCAPFSSTGGRFVIASFFALGYTVENGCSTLCTAIQFVIHGVLFVVFASSEGSGRTCFTPNGAQVDTIAQTFCHLFLPVVCLSWVHRNVKIAQQTEFLRQRTSDEFAKLCLRAALVGDTQTVIQTAKSFDTTSSIMPRTSDDAICAIVDLLEKNAQSIEVLRSSISATSAPQPEPRAEAQVVPIDDTISGLAILAAFSLPNLGDYAHHQDANIDHAKMFIGEFVDLCSFGVVRYGGELSFTSLETVFAKFPNPQTATAACLLVSDGAKKLRKHHMQVPVTDSRVLHPVCVVLQSRALIGSFGSSKQKCGFVEAADHFQRVAMLRKEGQLDKGDVFIPISMRSVLSDSFVVKETTHRDLLRVTLSLNVDNDGFPVTAPTGSSVTVNFPIFALPVLKEASASASLVGREPSFSGIPLSQSTAQPPPEVASRKSRSSRFGSSVHKSSFPPEAAALWEKYDKDGNGTLDIEECRMILADLGYELTDDDMQKFFDDVDKDGSGTISKTEFAAAFTQPTIGGAMVVDNLKKAGAAIAKDRGGDAVAIILEAWQKYDKDNSGSLDYTELANVLVDLGIAQSDEEIDWLVKKLDRDGSGTVDFDEFSRLFSSDNVSKQVAAKARSQVVSRVVNNRNSGVIFSNADQLLRDERVRYAALAERWVTLPLFLYVAYNCGSITFDIALGEARSPSTTKLIVDMVLDIFLVSWIVVKYLFLPREDKGQIAFHRSDVIRLSLRTFDFYVDILAVIPIDFVYIGLGDPTNDGVVGYYRLNKLLLYWYLDDCYKVISRNINPALARAANAVIYFMSFAHLFGCFLIGLARSVGENGVGMSDFIGYPAILSETDHTYLVALYWAIITLVGQDRSTILPKTDAQMSLLFVSLMVGLPMYAVVLGTISHAVQVDDSYSKFLDKIDSLRSYFQYTRLPEHIENECVAYYRHLFFTTGSLDITSNPLRDLPAELSIQVVIEVGQAMLRKVPIFQDATKNSEFVHELTTKLVPEVIPPLTTVMKKGERGTNMYFITFGDFNILADNGMAVFTLKKGNFFGEIALLHNVKRTATIQSFQRYANVLSLDKTDFDEVTATFPDCLSQVYKAAEDRIKQILDREAEEAKQAKEKRRAEKAEKKRESVALGNADEDDSSDEDNDGKKERSGSVTLELNKSQARLGSRGGSRNSTQMPATTQRDSLSHRSGSGLLGSRNSNDSRGLPPIPDREPNEREGSQK